LVLTKKATKVWVQTFVAFFMIQTTTLLTTYNEDIMGNSFLKVKHFLREFYALLMTYLPTLPPGRQAQAGISKND
jgi:hypothetical protein